MVGVSRERERERERGGKYVKRRQADFAGETF